MQIGNQKYNLQIAAGGIAILFAWFDFIWFLKRYSLLGIYILMANKVFITLFKVRHQFICAMLERVSINFLRDFLISIAFRIIVPKLNKLVWSYVIGNILA